MHDAEGLDELGGRGRFVHVACGACGYGFEDALVVHAGAGHNDTQVGTDGFHAGHDVVEILTPAITQQDEVDVRQLTEIGERGGDQFQVGFAIEEGTESYKSQRIAFHHGDTYEGLSGDGSFHLGFPVRIASCSSLPEVAGNWNAWCSRQIT